MGFKRPSSIEFEMSGWMRTDLRVVVRRLLLGLLVVVVRLVVRLVVRIVVRLVDVVVGCGALLPVGKKVRGLFCRLAVDCGRGGLDWGRFPPPGRDTPNGLKICPPASEWLRAPPALKVPKTSGWLRTG